MSFIDDVGSRLVGQGVGKLGVNIFLGSAAILPTPQLYPSGDATKGLGPYLVVTETGGIAPSRVQNFNGAKTKLPTAQIMVIAKAYDDARNMSASAYAALDGVFNALVGGNTYLSIKARQEPTDMGFDATGVRVQVVFNVEAEFMAIA